jgi:hypothetical protein
MTFNSVKAIHQQDLTKSQNFEIMPQKILPDFNYLSVHLTRSSSEINLVDVFLVS